MLLPLVDGRVDPGRIFSLVQPGTSGVCLVSDPRLSALLLVPPGGTETPDALLTCVRVLRGDSPQAGTLPFAKDPRATVSALRRFAGASRGVHRLLVNASRLALTGPAEGRILLKMLEATARWATTAHRSILWILPVLAPVVQAVEKARPALSLVAWVGEEHGAPWIQVVSASGTIDPALLARHPLLHPDAIEDEHGDPLALLSLVMERLPIGVVFGDVSGRVFLANARASELLGRTGAGISSSTVRDAVAPESRRTFLRFLAVSRAGAETEACVRVVREGGADRILDLHALRAPRNERLVTIVDVTSRQEEEADRARTAEQRADILNSAPTAYGVVRGARLASWNKALETLLSAVGKNVLETTTAEELLGRKTWSALRAAVLEGTGTPRMVELTLEGSEGRRRFVEVTGRLLERGHRTAVALWFDDVDASRRAVEGARAAETALRSIVENIGAAAVIVQNDLVTFATASFLRLLGGPASAEVVGHALADWIAPRDRERFNEALGGEGAPAALRLRKKGGEKLAVELTARSVPAEGGETLVCSFTDRSAHVRLLDDLRRRERERDIVDPLVAALHRSLDPAEVAGATFREVLKRLGFTRGLLALTDPQGTFVPFAHEGISETLITAVSGLSVHEGLGAFFAKTHQPLAVGLDEYPPYLPLRAQWELEGFRAVAFLPLPADDGLVGLLILGTEKPLAEDDDRGWLLELIAGHVAHAVTNARRHAVLAASEELHRSSVEGLQDAVYRLTPAGALAYLSPRIEELTGYRAEEFFRTADFWRSVVHPDDRTEYSLRVSGHADGSAGRELHYRMLPRGRAEYRHVRDAVRYLRAGDGTLTGLVGVLSVVAPAPRTEVEHPGELVFDGIADGVAVFDPSATCIVWNAAAAALTGIDRARALGNPPPAPEGLEELDAAVRSALAGEIVAPLSWQAQADRPGSGRVTCTAVRGPSGAVTAVVVTFHGEGRGEQDPHAPEETLRRIVNAMGDALVISDLEGRVWEVSGEFTRMTGYTRQEVLGVAFPYPWIPDEEMGTYVHWVAALRERQSLHDFDSVWRARDGRPVAVSITTTMLRTALGEPMAMVNVARDIGERKRLAQEMALLSDLGRDLGGVVDGPGVLAVVLDGLRTAVGAESAALFRKSGREWMSETVVPASSAVPLDAEVIALLRRAEETGKGSVGGGDENTLLAIPLRMKQGRGETLFVRIAGGRRDARPELRLAQNIATLTSISLDRALLYDETLAKSQEIARRNKELDDFAYVVSHDLKEPLITIEGYAKILIEECAGALPVEAGEYLQTVRRSGQRMQRLIDDLLTLSRVGRGEESLSAVDSSRVVDEVLAEMSFTLRERGATVERPETLPVVRTNRTHLLMVFRNLIANAVKFTTGDNPRVAVTAREGDGEVVFGVADNGIGIAPEHHERIFEIFRRLHPEGEFPGTGAGLTIVRRIVERHHGRIWVESALGAGSTFFFTVPKETAQS